MPAPPSHAPPPGFFRLTVQPRAVRDVAIPLGGFTNVVVAHRSPRLPKAPGSSGSVSTRKKVRTSPPVLLPRRGEVALPGAGHVRDFKLRDEAHLMPLLSAEPLLLELWHSDKYTADVLLGMATVDLAEVLSTRPIMAGGIGDEARVLHRQEQTVPFVAPPEGVLPSQLANGPTPHLGGGGSSGHVALLDVSIRLEVPEAAPAPPPPMPPTDGGPSDAVSRRPHSAGGALAEASGYSAEVAEAWRKKEQERWRGALKRKEEERLGFLAREWKVHEAKRASEARAQFRALEDVTRELRNKLASLGQHEQLLTRTYEQLELKGVELEQRGEIEKAEIAANAERAQSGLEAELASASNQLREAELKSNALQRQALSLTEREARAETQATVWREAHASASAKALALQSDKGQLSAALESERQRLAKMLDDQRAATEAARLAAEAAQAEAQRRVAMPEELLPPDEATLLPGALGSIGAGGGGGSAAQLAGAGFAAEVSAMDQRLRQHSESVAAEAKELEDFRAALAAHVKPRERRSARAPAAAERPRFAVRRVPEHLEDVRMTYTTALPPAATAGVSSGVAASRAAAAAQRAAIGGVSAPPAERYNLRSLVQSIGSEESWWERYQRDVLEPQQAAQQQAQQAAAQQTPQQQAAAQAALQQAMQQEPFVSVPTINSPARSPPRSLTR